MALTYQKQYLDVEFKVFIHGKDVVENVLSDARDDSHLVRVVQLTLKWEVTDKMYNCERNGHPGSKVNTELIHAL